MIFVLFFMLIALIFFVLKLALCIANGFSLLYNKLGIDSEFWGDKNV